MRLPWTGRQFRGAEIEMSEAYRPEAARRFLHWLEGERWCAVCQAWAPLAHGDDHPPLPLGQQPAPRRRYTDSEHGQRHRRSNRR